MKLEALESRRMFDATFDTTDVTVTEGYPGFYEIRGTEGDDSIDASINMAEQTLKVNGRTYSSVSYIVAYGFGGNDRIMITPIDGAGIIGASVVAGDGNDTVFLGVDGAIWAGQGNDDIYLLDSFRGEAYGEAGNDFIQVSGLTSDAAIMGGDGHDYIDCASNQNGCVVYGGSGNDTIMGSEFGDELYGDDGRDILYGNGGNDMIYAQGGGADEVYGGDGDDIAYIDAEHDVAEAEQVYLVYG